MRHTLIFLVCQFCLIMRSKTQKSKISDFAKRDCRLRMKFWYLLKQTIILLTRNIAFPLVFVFSRRWLTCKREETRYKICGLGLMERRWNCQQHRFVFGKSESTREIWWLSVPFSKRWIAVTRVQEEVEKELHSHSYFLVISEIYLNDLSERK